MSKDHRILILKRHTMKKFRAYFFSRENSFFDASAVGQRSCFIALTILMVSPDQLLIAAKTATLGYLPTSGPGRIDYQLGSTEQTFSINFVS